MRSMVEGLITLVCPSGVPDQVPGLLPLPHAGRNHTLSGV